MSRYLVALGIAVTVILWSSAFAGIRAALNAYSPQHLALLRYLIASVVLLGVAAVRGIRLPRVADMPRLFVTGLFGIGIYNILLNIGEQTVSAGATSFIINTLPIFTTLLSIAFLSERIDRVGWAGMLLSFAGVSLIALGEGGRMQFEPGALVILVSALCSSLYFVVQKPLLERYSSLEAVSWAIWTGTLVMLPFAGGLRSEVAAAPPGLTLTVVYLGIFPAVVAYSCWTFVLSRMSASRATSFLYFVPPATLVCAWVWLGEVPGALSILGGGLALIGVVVVNRFARHWKAGKRAA
jgi:drug/metabolite transporter (DMT)-like permease